jgi:imidazolonepropionase-like amidohydrolase
MNRSAFRFPSRPLRALALGFLLLGTLATATTVNAAEAPRALWFHQVRVFDGKSVLPMADVLVLDGRIAALGPEVKAPGDAVKIDGHGKTLLPGLIDAHTHIYPGALQQALAFGVTTELDMFSDPKLDAQLRDEQSEGKGLDRADLRSAGVLATAPKGHGTEFGIDIPTLTSPAEAQGFVDARIAEGSDYIKIIYDDGSTYGLHFPTLSPETMKAVIAATHKRGKLAVVHIGSLADAREAIADGADGLAHLFVDRAPDPEFGRFVAAHHAFVVPTLTVLESIALRPSGAALAKDPRFIPFIPPVFLGNLERSFGLKSASPMHYEGAEEAVKQLKAAGVPLLAGSDAPNPGTAHGASLHRELELLVKAGLTPLEALTAATATPARIFGLTDRGRIAQGLRADLLLVSGDPTQDILATRDIAGIWKAGVPFDRNAYRASLETAKTTAAAPPTGSENGLVSDFDDGTTKTAFGAGWQISTDQLMGGKSTAKMEVVPVAGAADKNHALQITGTLQEAAGPKWAGAMYFPGATLMAPANLGGKKAIHFKAKGDGKTYSVLVFTLAGGRIPAFQTFTAGPQWQEVNFPLSAFQTDGHDLNGIAIVSSTSSGPFVLEIDDFGFR